MNRKEGEAIYIPEIPADEWVHVQEYRDLFTRFVNSEVPYEKMDLKLNVRGLGSITVGAWWSEQWSVSRGIRFDTFAAHYDHVRKQFNVINASNVPNHQRFEEAKLYELFAEATEPTLKGVQVPWTYSVQYPNGEILEMDLVTQDQYQTPGTVSYEEPSYRLQWDQLPGILDTGLQAAYTTDPYLADLQIRINTEPLLK